LGCYRYTHDRYPLCVKTHQPNKDRNLHWFHAFILSTLAAFAGGTFNFIWMGQPSGILSNDVFMAASIISFMIVNYIPGDLGYTLLKTFPVSLLTVSLAQLFRSLGTIKFLTACYTHFKDSTSKYDQQAAFLFFAILRSVILTFSLFIYMVKSTTKNK
jgi:hypothetical protein